MYSTSFAFFVAIAAAYTQQPDNHGHGVGRGAFHLDRHCQRLKVHRFLDLNRPLFGQIWYGGFSRDFYLEQVHKPRHYKGGASAPLFGNFLEPLTKTPWWLIPMIWLPCISYGVVLANEGFSSPIFTGAWWTAGFFIWFLIEYGMHRCLFHVDEYVSSILDIRERS